ncbi:MAG: HlyD family secretion protein [Alphaproteobacteria bacterium]|nr:HlyD family secretion protein [Alphaproteobacteria bacterium]
MDQSVTSPLTPATPSIGALPRRKRWSVDRGRWLLRPRSLAAIAGVLLALVYGGREIYLRWTHIYEYDARVTADIVTISSRADGWLVDMPVREGMRVTKGQNVARIDDRVAKLRADALQAQIEGIKAERARLRAERLMNANQNDALMRTRTSTVMVREKALAALKSDLDLARLELERNRALFERRVANERQLQVSQAAVAKLESQILQLQAEHEQAEGSLDEARMQQDRLVVIDAQIAALDHQAANLTAQLSQQTVDIEDRTIRSPIPAVIDRTFVLPGEYLQAGQRILLLHDPSEVWVEANIKETHVGRLKLGQKVFVSVDAYPDDRFVGRVARIGSATTARFALIPTPNPSGNFTKITQRMPVKIDMVEMPKPLTPGMMVEVEIDIR